MWNFIIPVVVGAVAAVVAYANGKDDGKKKQKKKYRRAEAERQRQAEAERQRQIALQRQAEEEEQRQIALQRQAEEEEQRQIALQRQAEEEEQRQIERERQRQQERERKRQEIFAFIEFFASKSLQELTLERLENAGNDWEELCAIEQEAKCAQNIESNANVLPTAPYCEEIKQRLFDAYSTRDIEELEALMEELEQFQRLVQSIKSCSLSTNLQQITDERVANAGINMEELRKIEREALCASNIEQECIKLDKQGCVTYPIRKKLEDAYRNHNVQMLSKIMAEVKQLLEIYELIHSIKTYSLKLSDNLQKITDEKLNKAGHNIDELHRIEQEVCDICGIERFFSSNEQYAKDISKTLENAYRNRDSNEIESLRQMIRNIEISRSRWRNPFT